MNPFEKLRMAAQAVRQALPEQSSWSTPETRQAERWLEAGKNQEAERLLVYVVNELKARTTIKPQHGHVLLCLAIAQFRQDKFQDAWITADAVRELLSAPKVKPGADLAAALDLLGRIKDHEGEPEAALKFFAEALETQKQILPADVAAIVERSCRLAAALERCGRLGDAVEVLESAIERADQVLGNVHPATADCLIELGKIESERGRHAAALAHLERALKIHQELHGMDSEVVVRDLQMLAIAAQAAQDLEAAVGYYERALNLRERQLGGSSEEVADILVNLAGVHSDLGRYGPAMELLQQAVGRLEAERSPALMTALEKLGAVYTVVGRYEDAHRSLQKARKLYEQDPERYYHALQANAELLAEIQPFLPVRTAPEIPIFRETPAAAAETVHPQAPVTPVEAHVAVPAVSPLPVATVPLAAVAGPQLTPHLAGSGKTPAGTAHPEHAPPPPITPLRTITRSTAPAHRGGRFSGWEELDFDVLAQPLSE